MKNTFAFSLALLIFLAGCQEQEHPDDQVTGRQKMEALSYTIYTDKTELFVEFSPLVAGQESRFAAHFTHLGEVFTPFTEGTITLTLETDGKSTAVTAENPATPGIFRLRLTPQHPGEGRLIFDIRTAAMTDQIILDNITVFKDAESAISANPPQEENADDVTYLKEQAWKTEFANVPVKKMPFSEVIRTSGQILSAPGDEVIVSARSAGIVRFAGKTTAGAAVEMNERLFVVSGGGVTADNIDVKVREAQANYEKTKADLDRARTLVKDNLVTQKDLSQRQNEFEIAQAQYLSLVKNYSPAGLLISSGVQGFIKDIYVSEGQFVNAGQPLASISQNRRLLLKAEVSQKHVGKLRTITSANFKGPFDKQVYNTDELHGSLLSYGKSTTANTPFVPVIFGIDNTGELPPGSFVDVYLKSGLVDSALIIPVSALIEEQGLMFVYVQVDGERFRKREVRTGATDGVNIQVLSGVAAGERVVSRGAYQIRLAAMSGSMPEHGHEH